MEIATAFPGNQRQIPNSVAPLAEMLRLNGYNTAAFGKWHETAPWEVSVSGPFDRWPTTALCSPTMYRQLVERHRVVRTHWTERKPRWGRGTRMRRTGDIV